MPFRIVLTLFVLLFAFTVSAQPSDFVHVVDGRVELGNTGQPVWLRGMGMGNFVADGVTDPDTLYLHHDSTTFHQLASFGITAIRFNMRSDAFETSPYTYSDETFDWLATNARWAAANHLYLIPVMMALPGTSPGDVTGFWDTPDNLERFKSLWVELATRFASEPAIAAYDLMNEPIPSQSPEQWMALAQETIDSIRTVDPNHMILLEPLYGVSGNWEGDYDNPDDVMFLVDDDNVLYDVHFYRPLEFTHWYQYGPDLPNWPDQRLLHFPADAEWITGTSSNPSPLPGNSDWTFYPGNLFLVDNEDLAFGTITLMSGHNPGRVWFDDVSITRHTNDGTLLDTVFADQISTTEDWLYAYQQYGTDMLGCDTTGFSDQFSLLIQGASGYGGWRSRAACFPVEQGEVYRASGAMMAEEMPDTGFALLRLDFYSDPAGSGLVAWDRDYLEGELERWTAFGQERHVPMNIGEFGVDRDLLDEHGGLQWIEEMLDLMIERDLHFTYHLYDLVHDRQDVFDIFGATLLPAAVHHSATTISDYRVDVTLYPNPGNSMSTVRIALPHSGFIEVRLFNMLGQHVFHSPLSWRPGGKSHLPLNLSQLSSGTYLLQVTDGVKLLSSTKMTIVK